MENKITTIERGAFQDLKELERLMKYHEFPLLSSWACRAWFFLCSLLHCGHSLLTQRIYRNLIVILMQPMLGSVESVINAPPQPLDNGTSPESGVLGLISKASVLWGLDRGLLGTAAQSRGP
ncbi:hypothetical protein NQZ68_031364 [Dissostichus eleginoides]|nr:hypothetical protein NQZ68_031364 [Dissostichus eleginoides]